MKIYITTSAFQTKKIAKELFGKITAQAKRLQKSAMILALNGNLGAGKTTFIQGFLRAAGVKRKITSPTFVIFKKFAIRNPKSETNLKFPPKARLAKGGKTPKFKNFYHVDCYRIHNPKEIIGLGFKEILKNPQNLILIEWSERIKKLLPKNTIWFNFQHGKKENERIIKTTSSFN